ncbi:MAG: response regulator transcription factor [Ignavibacteriales bacterium]|nr:response regulator transcription factor [Ignavibacteriales bacterium]
MKTVLVVDDEQDIVQIVKYNLEKEGFAVLTARNGKQALEQAQSNPQLILLDVMMPELDGLEVLNQLKRNKQTEHIPVIFLTARSSEIDEVIGLELGADDYIVKPISIPKLIARVKTVLRKHETKENVKEATPLLQIGVVEINTSQHIIRIKGKELFFPKKEFDLLLFLARREGEVVNRDTLLTNVWGSDVIVGDRTIDVHIRKIREKLGKYADYIETIKGVGYKLRMIE